jgi:hypothetical protein
MIFLWFNPLYAEEPVVRVKGKIIAWKQESSTEMSDLVPFPDASGFARHKGGWDALLSPRIDWGSLSLNGKFRMAFESKDIDDIHVDESYAEFRLSDYVFIQGGRRLLSYGQSYGLNPADIFRDPLRENSVFPREISSSFVAGTDYVETEVLFETGSTLGLLYAPGSDLRGDGDRENFVVLRYSGLVLDGAINYAVAGLGGKRPGASLSLSYGLGLDSILYVDSTIRKGRDRLALDGTSPSGALLVASRDEDTYYPFVTLGLGHTLVSGLTLNLEYTHNAGGYNAGEWGDFRTTLDDITPVSSVGQGTALGQLNGLLNHYTLRQNYIFWRLAQEELFGIPLNGELTLLHGIDDGSVSAGLRMEYIVSETLTVGTVVSRRYGETNSEFTLRPSGNSMSFYATMSF